MMVTKGGVRQIPLEVPNAASAQESVHKESIQHGHPSSLHLWRAIRTLA